MSLTLRVWRFIDGRSGHEKQTEGLVQGLGACLPDFAGEASELEVRDIAMVDFAEDSSALWRDPGQAPDLLIGAGRSTHVPMALTRWHLGSRAVVLMKPSLPSFCYDLAVVPEHDNLWSERKVLRSIGAMGPSVTGAARSNRGLILLGGENPHFYFADPVVAASAAQIIAQSPEVHWQISDSPRSSPNLIRLVSEAIQDAANATVVHYRDNSSAWLSQELSQAGQVWVSADSASMLYEALSSNACVGVIELTSKGQRNKLAAGIKALREQNRLGRLCDGSLDRQSLNSEPLREHLRCARWILERWFN